MMARPKGRTIVLARLLLACVACGGAGCPPGSAPLPVSCPPPVSCPQPSFVAPPVTCGIETDRSWVAPVHQTVLTGYDHCGRPIYQQVCVSQGYWRTAQYRVSSCGERTFIGWLP